MSEKNYHYVYKLIDKITGEFYYGSRSCNCKPEFDVDYMGSMVTWKPTKNNLIKELIEDYFEDRIHAIEYENKLITEHINDTLNRNYATPYGKFYRFGPPVNKGVKNPQHSKRMIGELNPRYGENDISVIQYDKMGQFVKKWDSIREASIELDIKYEYIKGCIFGKKRIVFGYMWRRYEDEDYERCIQPYKRKSHIRGKYKIKNKIQL